MGLGVPGCPSPFFSPSCTRAHLLRSSFVDEAMTDSAGRFVSRKMSHLRQHVGIKPPPGKQEGQALATAHWEEKNPYASAKFALARSEPCAHEKRMLRKQDESGVGRGMVSQSIVNRIVVNNLAHNLASAVQIGPGRPCQYETDCCGGVLKRSMNTGRGQISKTAERWEIHSTHTPLK